MEYKERNIHCTNMYMYACTHIRRYQYLRRNDFVGGGASGGGGMVLGANRLGNWGKTTKGENGEAKRLGKIRLWETSWGETTCYLSIHACMTCMKWH